MSAHRNSFDESGTQSYRSLFLPFIVMTIRAIPLSGFQATVLESSARFTRARVVTAQLLE